MDPSAVVRRTAAATRRAVPTVVLMTATPTATIVLRRNERRESADIGVNLGTDGRSRSETENVWQSRHVSYPPPPPEPWPYPVPPKEPRATTALILGLVGLINLPIVKFSVDWWNTLHQPASLLRAGGPSMPAEYLTPLLTMMAAWGLFFAAVWLTAIRTEIVRRRVLSIRARRALEA